MKYSDSSLQPRLVSILKTAELLGIGRTKTYALIADETLETISIGGRRLVTLRSIDNLIESARAGGAA